MTESPREIAARLIAVLGPTLVASLAGIRDVSLVRAWTSEGVPVPLDAVPKLRCAIHVWRMVSQVEGDDVARAWFVGANPWLGDHTAIAAIRDGRFDEARRAAKALVDDSFSG